MAITREALEKSNSSLSNFEENSKPSEFFKRAEDKRLKSNETLFSNSSEEERAKDWSILSHQIVGYEEY